MDLNEFCKFFIQYTKKNLNKNKYEEWYKYIEQLKNIP